MLFHSCILGLVALGTVVAVDEVDLLAVGHTQKPEVTTLAVAVTPVAAWTRTKTLNIEH